MGDEVRITVIATGFDEDNKRPSMMTMSSSEDRKPIIVEPKPVAPAPMPMEIRKPLFNPAPAQPIQSINRQQIRNEPTPPTSGSEEDELDIPAFIRKKMK